MPTCCCQYGHNPDRTQASLWLFGAPEAATVAGGKADMRTSYQLSSSIRVLLTASLAAIPLGLVAFPATAQDAAAPSSATQTSAPRPSQSYKPYFVEFRARSAASYGHMYVLYGQLNGHGEIVKSDIAGLHPAGDANNCDNCSLIPWTLGHILFVPSETGASDGDLEEKYQDVAQANSDCHWRGSQGPSFSRARLRLGWDNTGCPLFYRVDRDDRSPSHHADT